MCGIFGHYSISGADPALIARMAARLTHRGPDGQGTFQSADRRLAFGAGRLAIIDLTAPAGPIFNEDQSVGVVFNGEIYNYRGLRATLETLGHQFATKTDTEVIVHGYESWGVGILERLRGMFALGLYEVRHQRLLLARDRVGEKPLYYTTVAGGILFASEAKALFEHPAVHPAVNVEMLPVYLTLGYVPAPQTMFQGIDKLAPGEVLTLKDGQLTGKRRYWQAHLEVTRVRDYRETVQEVRRAVEEAVETRMVSDVPVGAFLSGGLDSTAVVALMTQHASHPIKTFTVGFDIQDNPVDAAKFNVDRYYAQIAATHLQTDHHALSIRIDERLSDLLPQLVYSMDEPVAQQSIVQTALIAGLARNVGVPVLLSGDGGDELFAGYEHYRADRLVERYQQLPTLVRNSVSRLPLSLFPKLAKLVDKAAITDPTQRYLTWMRLIDPARLPDLLRDPALASRALTAVNQVTRPLLDAPQTRHFADRIAFTSFNLWLAEDSNMRVDKMSMAMSVETRAPLEDHQLVDLAFSIPLEFKLRHGDFKRVFKDAVADLIPPPILNRPKWGFASPTSQWLRTVFKPLVDKYLSIENVERVGYFNAQFVSKLVANHLSKQSYEVWAIWPLLIFHLWHALYIEGSLVLTERLTPEAMISYLQ